MAKQDYLEIYKNRLREVPSFVIEAIFEISEIIKDAFVANKPEQLYRITDFPKSKKFKDKILEVEFIIANNGLSILFYTFKKRLLVTIVPALGIAVWDYETPHRVHPTGQLPNLPLDTLDIVNKFLKKVTEENSEEVE